MESRRIRIEQSGNESPGIVNVLLGLSIRRRIAMLKLLGLDVDPTMQVGVHNDLIVDVPWLSGEHIAVFAEASDRWEWQPLNFYEKPTEGRMAGTVPQDFSIYLRIDRRVSWESDQIPLDDSSEAQFVGSSLRSLLLLMGLSGSIDSSWLRYLARHPERLDEDLDALKSELGSEELGWN